MYKITVGCFIILKRSDIIAKKNELIQAVSLLAIILSVVTISICALSLSSIIKIENYDLPDTPNWDLNFLDLSDVELTGNAKEIEKPVIDKKTTYIKDFYISFTDNLDSATYNLAIKNNGKIDAKVSSITLTEPVCYGSGKSAINDALMVCENVQVSATYESGKEIKLGDILKQGDKENIKLTIKYTGEMPVEPVEIENLSMTIIYIQE